MRKRYVLVVLSVMLVAANKVSAQSATSGIITFSLSDVTPIFMPPELYIDVDFIDDNDNKILEALENGVLRLDLSNRGGDANDVIVTVTPQNSTGIVFNSQTLTTSVKSNEHAVLDFPISASINVPTDSVHFSIKVSESLGYDLNASVVLSTYEYMKSKLEMQGVTILDAGMGLRAANGNPDGMVQKGDVVRATVTLQNTGTGEANNIWYRITTANPNVLLMTETGNTTEITGAIDNMLSGEAKEVSFRLSANNNYNASDEYLPVYIEVTEDKNFGNLQYTNIPIPLGKTPEKPRIVDIKGERDKLLAMQQLKVYSSTDPSRFTSNQKIRDISVAPAGDPIYRDAVAIVIGAEKNSYGVAPAPYAARDASVMAKYFKNSLGIQDNNIKVLTDDQVTKNALSDLFDIRYGYLSRVVVPKETDVFVYYSGHGIPDVTDNGEQDIYLFPYDARKELVKDRGYSLNKLYADLNSLEAKSVTVILDACFSGSSRQTVTHESENISNEKGIRISMPQMTNRPWDTNPNFRVFTSSTEDQTSLGYDQSQSGLFTYFLATGLQGDADKDQNGTIQFSELVDYVTTNVSNESQKIRGGAQNPQFYGNGNFTIVKIR